jgi:hypothetical protein
MFLSVQQLSIWKLHAKCGSEVCVVRGLRRVFGGFQSGGLDFNS